MADISPTNATSLPRKPRMESIGVVVILAMFYVFIAISAIASNVTILIAIFRQLVPRNTVNVFFSSLAVSDLLMVGLSLLDCSAYLNGGWVFGVITCKIQSLLLEVSFSASTLTLVAVSCERYLLICQPHMKQRSLKNIYKLLGSVWFLSFVIASPLLHGYIVLDDINFETKSHHRICVNKGWSTKYRLVYYSSYSIVVYITPLLVMAFTHWRISKSVREHHQRQEHSQTGRFLETKCKARPMKLLSTEGSTKNSGLIEETDVPQMGFHKVLLDSIMHLKSKRSSLDSLMNIRSERRIKAVRMLFVVTVTFFILWTPFIIMRLLKMAGGRIGAYVYKFSEILVFSSTAVNGFIYAYMSTPFRKAFKAILYCQKKDDIILTFAGSLNSNSDDHKPSRRYTVSNGSTPNKERDLTCFNKKRRCSIDTI